MLVGLGWLHALLWRGVLWVLKLPFQALGGTLKAMLALVGEEVRRWLSVLVSGLLIYLLAKAVLAFGHPPKPALWTVALMAALWFWAVLRAAHYSVHNNLLKVRQRQAFKQLSADVNKIGNRVGERVTDGMARAAEGTPVGRAFRSNRERQAQADRDAAVAARQAEAEAEAVAEHQAHWEPERVTERRAAATDDPDAVVAKGGYRVV